jgi:hypothetical protein
MSQQFLRRLLALAALGLIVASPFVQAQDAPPVRVRGTIERVDGNTYFVKSREGAELKIALTEKAIVAALVNATLADIKEGSFVGIAALPQADGSQRALEVHIFSEEMRAFVKAAHTPWDLQPKSTMTNGDVAQTKAGADGQTLIVKHKDGETSVLVPAGTPIVSYTAGDRSELKAGAKIFIGAAKKLPDGSLEAGRINVGRGGVAPPM